MTKKEIYQALADGKATSVQRLGSDGMYGEEWVTAKSEHQVIGWLAFDTANFDPKRYRLKPTPVPPGDLTREEAEYAFKEGKKVEWWNDCDISWHEKISCAFHEETAYRLAPAPKMRTIKAEELPAFFWVRLGKDDTSLPVEGVTLCDNEIRIDCTWYMLSYLRNSGATYSEHHSKGPWHKFEVEDV